MNRKTFAVAAIFFLASLAWFVINVVWAVARRGSMADLLIALFFLIAGIGINVSQTPEDFSPEVRTVATSLVQEL